MLNPEKGLNLFTHQGVRHFYSPKGNFQRYLSWTIT